MKSTTTSHPSPSVPNTFNGLALCAGIGGLELGLRLAIGSDYRTVCYVEREAYAASVLVARMEDSSLDRAPVWGDVTTFDSSRWRGIVDIVSSGFPCQPYSTAPRGRNREDGDMWPSVIRVVGDISPNFVFLENVRTAPWGKIRLDLKAHDYRVEIGEFCPSLMGAPHKRPRTFLLAHSDRKSQPRSSIDEQVARIQAAPIAHWFTVPQGLGVDDGDASRMDRLRCLGNAVVPQCAARAFTELWERLR